MNVEHKKATKSVKDLMIEWSSNSFARGGRLKVEMDVDRAQSCPFCGTTIQPYRSEFGKRRLVGHIGRADCHRPLEAHPKSNA